MSRDRHTTTEPQGSGERRRGPGQQGFTLIEALVALFIVSLIFLSIAQLMTVGLFVHQAAEDMTATTALAQERMEALRARDYDGLAPGGGLDSDVPGYFDEPDLDGDGNGDFKRRWEITDLGAGRKRVRVRVVSPLSLVGTPKETLFVAVVSRK